MDMCRRISGVDTSGFGCTVTLPPVVSRTGEVATSHIRYQKSRIRGSISNDLYLKICISTCSTYFVTWAPAKWACFSWHPARYLPPIKAPGSHGDSWSQVSGEYGLAYTYTLYWNARPFHEFPSLSITPPCLCSSASANLKTPVKRQQTCLLICDRSKSLSRSLCRSM